MRSLLSMCILAVPCLLVTPACKPALIPGTSLEDTAENRDVLLFLAKYRDAVTHRSTDGVIKLCAPTYFEDNGTSAQEDDYGLDGLREKLDRDFKRTKEIQLELVVQSIARPQGDKGPVQVVFRFSQRALVDLPAGAKWITLSDVNRLVLSPGGEAGFTIQSGL